MSVASRYAEMQKHVGNAYTEISRLGVDLTNVDKNIDNIADKLQEAYSQSPKVTDEGSNLSLTPTRKGGLTIIPKGACEQDSTTGKNKLPYSNETTKTFAGNTATQENGIYTITGTADGSGGLNFELFKTYTIQDGDYIHCLSNRTDSNIQFAIRDENSTAITAITLNQMNKIVDLSSYAGQKIKYAGFYKNAYYSGDLTCKAMILNNVSTSSDWEPYTGGIPAPNPDYPQDIRVVTGDNSVVVSSGNKFDKNNIVSGYSIQSDGTIQENENFGYTELIPVKSLLNVQYKISGLVRGSQNWTLRIHGYNNLGNWVQEIANYIIAFGAEQDRTFTIPSGISYIRISLRIVNGQDLDTFKLTEQQTTTLHLGTNYLAGIGDYKDEIVGKTDEWKIVRKVGKVVLSNIEGTGVNNLYRNLDIKSPIQQAFLKHFINVVDSRIDSNYWANEILDNNEFSFRVHETNNYLFLKSTLSAQEITALNDEIFLVLATPVEIPIIDTTLINDLNNMYQAMGYDGTTNITITSDTSNAQMTASVSALKGE